MDYPEKTEAMEKLHSGSRKGGHVMLGRKRKEATCYQARREIPDDVQGRREPKDFR